ncbi:MAG: futalosine hydrolase [Sphingobacterium sp.]|jgi:futalosine hydrolase|nr:futalosine hydrolase [Sphingobacterium sp.]
MRPLIVAATDAEIAPSIDFLKRLQIPYLTTGVGMTATAYQLGKSITQIRPDYILNVGIGGALDKDIPLGTVVQVTKDSFSELGAEDGELFLPIEELGFGKSVFTPPTPSLASPPQLVVHTGITVNTVHGNEQSILLLKARLSSATIETMEGAAVFFVSEAENIPCLQIRAISNYVEKRNRQAWEIPLAIKNLNMWLQEFILKNSL